MCVCGFHFLLLLLLFLPSFSAPVVVAAVAIRLNNKREPCQKRKESPAFKNNTPPISRLCSSSLPMIVCYAHTNRYTTTSSTTTSSSSTSSSYATSWGEVKEDGRANAAGERRETDRLLRCKSCLLLLLLDLILWELFFSRDSRSREIWPFLKDGKDSFNWLHSANRGEGVEIKAAHG